jgi:NADPH-dependent glutamate synthase beta subunit-like oxidoreductase
LPREILDAEIDVIKHLGVEIRCNTTIGKDISLEQIRGEFPATVIAVGAKHSRKLHIEGEDADGVLGGVEFLRELSLGRVVGLGKQVVVIGGGFTAMDCSRSSLRVGVTDVITVLYRRTRDEMPVGDEELEEASSEGINFKYLVTPIAIEKDANGKVAGVRLQENRLGPPDGDGRRRPIPVPESEFVQPCDTVILAIGQQTDLGFVDEQRDGLSFNKWGLIDCDEETLATKAPDVFMAGDAAYGAKLMIDAIASGKKAARSMYHYLTGSSISIELLQNHLDLGRYERENGFEAIPRTVIPVEKVQKRIADLKAMVEIGYDKDLAESEASRCLDCGINTIFDGQRCILCGGCVDVCPNLCLKLVPLQELNLTESQQAKAADCLGGEWQQDTAIIKDEEACIRCGLCAKRCPTTAITMERMEFSEEWS